MRISMNSFDQWGVGEYRAKLPLRFCHSDLSDKGVCLQLHDSLNQDSDADAYIIHRCPNENVAFFFDEQQKKGRKFVHEVDDDICNVPEWMPSEEFHASKWAYKKCLSTCNEIWTSTEYLKGKLGYPAKTKVLPNLVDFNGWLEPQTKDGITRILWAGSCWHEQDLEQITYAVLRILNEYSNVQFLFWGCLPSAFAEYQKVPGSNQAILEASRQFGTRLLYLTGVPFQFYYDRLTKLGATIGLAPLIDCEFNKGKSNLKYLEYSMAGIATVASNLEPYRCIENGKDGLLVHKDGWYEGIKTLLDNAALRKEMVSKAREKVRQEYSWQCSKKNLWVDAFTKLAGKS